MNGHGMFYGLFWEPGEWVQKRVEPGFGVTYTIKCCGELHTIYQYGEYGTYFQAIDHPAEDFAGEEIVEAFGGDLLPCYRAYLNHRKWIQQTSTARAGLERDKMGIDMEYR